MSPWIAPHAAMAAITRDKKARDGHVPFVLAPRIGAFRLVYDVPADDIRAVIAEHTGMDDLDLLGAPPCADLAARGARVITFAPGVSHLVSFGAGPPCGERVKV